MTRLGRGHCVPPPPPYKNKTIYKFGEICGNLGEVVQKQHFPHLVLGTGSRFGGKCYSLPKLKHLSVLMIVKTTIKNAFEILRTI